MRARFSRVWVISMVAAAIMAVGGGVFIRAAMASSQTPVTLSSVSSNQLASANIHLYAPSGTSKVTKASAEESAAGLFRNAGGSAARVLESQLVDVSDPNAPEINGKTLWVISINPADVHVPPAPDGSRMVLTFDIEFVDPTTGADIFGRGGR